MSTTHHELFSNTLQKTHLWLKDLAEELWWKDQERAYLALRATLHALRDRLTVEEAVHLGAQLPMLVRGFYYEGWSPAGKPVKEWHKHDKCPQCGALIDGIDMDGVYAGDQRFPHRP